MKIYVAAMVLILIACFSGAASAEEPQWYCSLMHLQSHAFGTTSNTYVITYKCDKYWVSHGADDYHHHNEYQVTFNGRYDVSTRKATEHIVEHVRGYKDGEQTWDWDKQYNSSAMCDHDPWLTGGGCQGGTYTIQPPPRDYDAVVTASPGPQSARLPQPVRTALNQEYAGHSEPPKIIQPGIGDKYDFPDDISIMIGHQPGRDIEFKIEWRPDAQHALQNVSTSFITAGLGGVSLAPSGNLPATGEGEYAITTARLHPHEKGEWTLRVKHQGATWWSDPVTFHVVTPLNTDPGQLNAPGQPLEKPVFLEPRLNNTYEATEVIPLKITFQKGYSLHYQLGIRAAGDTGPAKIVWKDRAIHRDNGFFEEALPGVVAVFAQSDVAELVITAWVEHPEATTQHYLAEKSEAAEMVVRVHAPKLQIKSPSEGQSFAAPANISFAIPFKYGLTGIPLVVEYSEMFLKNFDVELEKLSTATNLPTIFFRYHDAEPDGTLFGDLIMFRYQLTEPGTYRFRARIGASYGSQWSDWRTIQVTKNQPAVQVAGKPMTDGVVEQKSALPVLPEKQMPGFAPVISSPAENQKFKGGGLLPLAFHGMSSSQTLIWQVEFRPFAGKIYKKQNDDVILAEPSPSASTVSGKIKVRSHGEYRIRNRVDVPGSTWGPWRHFQIGEPVSTDTPAAARDIRPANGGEQHMKTAPGTSTPSTPLQTTSPAEQSEPKITKPAAPSAKPAVKKMLLK